MIGLTKKVAVVPLQSEANANYNPFPNDTTTNPTDIQAIKAAFLADQDVLTALKGSDGQQGPQGPQGNQGQAGPAGDSVIVRDTDPTDAISSKVGDLYLNATSGTLYQRSGITQAQFYAAGLQGLVLPNSIWIRKGNLKGATGDKGDKGDGIISGNGHPSNVVQTLPPVGTLYINKNTFGMYERSATEYIPGNVPGELPEDYTLGYWYALGSLRGTNGTNGTNGVNGTDGMDGNDGESAVRILSNYQVIGNYDLLQNDMGKTIVIMAQCGLSTMQEIDNYDGSIIVINDQNTNVTILNANGTQSVICSQKSVSVVSFKVDGSVSVYSLKGQNGTKIYTVSALPSNSADVQIYQNGDLMFNTTTGVLYEKSNMTAAQFLIQNSQQGTQGVVLANVVFLTKGNLKGTNGKDAVEILTGAGTVYLSNAQLGKYLVIPADSAITQISFRDTTIASTTTFLCLKKLQGGISYIPTNMDLPSQLAQAKSGDFFAIQNFTAPVDGYWFTKTDLRSGTRIKTGTDHLTFTDAKTGDLYINTSTGHYWKFTSAQDAYSQSGVWDDLGALGGATSMTQILRDQVFTVPLNIKNVLVHVSIDAQYIAGGIPTINLYYDTSVLEMMEILNPTTTAVNVNIINEGSLVKTYSLDGFSITKIFRVEDVQLFDFFMLSTANGTNSNRL
ncbi:hypothetical protein GCM10011514_16890 [Emticicia aquatilis]|uniref:Collagen-like protein n=1 Tax=Emticicia aquatilis TaxID=1537369 RepID=A0A916YN83_9BACT|nr:hypothetical protein [Emticicia aquatilis]GGD53398.1 hypothetical protein GCM10011514_16890 [Emticicia aquatilis]